MCFRFVFHEGPLLLHTHLRPGAGSNMGFPTMFWGCIGSWMCKRVHNVFGFSQSSWNLPWKVRTVLPLCRFSLLVIGQRTMHSNVFSVTISVVWAVPLACKCTTPVLVVQSIGAVICCCYRSRGVPGGGDSAGPRTPTTPAPPPPPPPRGLRPTVGCQRCCPQASMGAKGA